MTTWDDRYRSGSYQPPPGPMPLLAAKLQTLPSGRALDVATGTGRNAIFLAECGFEVDAIDRSRVALSRAQSKAAARGVEVNWIQADLGTFEFPNNHYAVTTISFYRAVDRLPDIKAALQPGGVQFHEHHLRSTQPPDRGPDSDRYRLAANDLLRSYLDLTVLYYEEGIRRAAGRRAAVATIMARNSFGAAQTYPDALLDEPDSDECH